MNSSSDDDLLAVLMDASHETGLALTDDDYDDDEGDEAADDQSACSSVSKGGRFADPPGDLENHRSIVLDDDYYDFVDDTASIEGDEGVLEDQGQERTDSFAKGTGCGTTEPQPGGVTTATQDSSRPSNGQGRRSPVRRTQSTSSRRRTSSGSSGMADEQDASARSSPVRTLSASSAPDESPRGGDRKTALLEMPTKGSPVVIRARRSIPTAGTPERRTRLLVRASDAPRTPTQRGARRVSRGTVVRAKSSGEDLIALQRAVAGSSLRRTPTRKRRVVVRSRSDSSSAPPPPTSPARSTSSKSGASLRSESDSNEGDDSADAPGDEPSSNSPPETISRDASRKSATTSTNKNGTKSTSSEGTKDSQKPAGLSKSCHTSKRSPSSSATASSRRSKELSSTSHGKSKSTHRRASGESEDDEKRDRGLGAHTIHVSRLSKERKRESKSSKTASSLQLNIGDPSSVDLESFPALEDTSDPLHAAAQPPKLRASTSLQLDISNPSNVNTCSFEPANGEGNGLIDQEDAPDSPTGGEIAVAGPFRQGTKESGPGLFSKGMSHILRHPIFSSQA